MATVSQSSRYLYPIAEIHWKTAIRRYGFHESSVLEQQWSSGCSQRILFYWDHLNTAIRAEIGGQLVSTIPYKHSYEVYNLHKDGYQIKKTLHCKDDRLGVFSLTKQGQGSERKLKHAIVVVDILERSIISCMDIKSSDGKEFLHHIEVWECDISKDGRFVTMAIALMTDDSFIHDACENYVTIYDRKLNREVKRYWNWDNVVCSLAFDPRYSHKRYAIVGMRQKIGQKSSLSTYSFGSDEPTQTFSVEEFIDREGETYFHICYSKDGAFLIMQVIENVAYSREWMYTTHIFNSDTLQRLSCCRPTVAPSCHTECVPRTVPLLSICGTYMALGSYEGKQKKSGSAEIEVYRLPPQLGLKEQCRALILRTVREQNDALSLPLPNMLINYLMWKPPDQLYSDVHTPAVKLNDINSVNIQLSSNLNLKH
jgi:hypothetical protein